MCVNETLFHVFQEKLPFGGIGPSGMGTHTGEAGIDRSFSAHKPVFRQAWLNSADLLNPPYGKLTDMLSGGHEENRLNKPRSTIDHREKVTMADYVVIGGGSSGGS